MSINGVNAKLDLKNIERVRSKLNTKRLKLTTGYNYNNPMVDIAVIQEYGATITVTERMRKFFMALGFENSPDDMQKYFVKVGKQIKIPARAFMHQAFAEFHNIWKKQLRQLYVDNNFDQRKALNQMGAIIRSDIQYMISYGDYAPNAPMTLAFKSGNQPLVNTGKLGRDIDYVVR